MSEEVCPICGFFGPSESHHVAGRNSNSSFTVNVCVRCHQKTLTPWQYVHRIPLRRDIENAGLVSLWATITGAAHVVEALCTRMGRTEIRLDEREDFLDVSSFIRRMSKEFRRMTDAEQDIPTPKTSKLRKGPVKKRLDTNDRDVIAILATMLAYLASVALGDDNRVTRFCFEVASDPQSFLQWCLVEDIEVQEATRKLSHAVSAVITILSDSGLLSATKNMGEVIEEMAKVIDKYMGV